MQTEIKREIKIICDRIFAKQSSKKKVKLEHRSRIARRTGEPPKEPEKKPVEYINRHFDPVYCKRNANFLTKTLWHKVLIQEYRPKPAQHFQIDKTGGGKRDIMAFSIPDTALANVLMRRIRERNLKRFSPHSFAYHPQRNIFDAILDLRGYIVSTDKVYSVKIDFEKYFESIPSKYIKNLLDNREMIVSTEVEKKAVRAFMFHKYASKEGHAAGSFMTRRIGTPQGSSISLLLANLANHQLDVRLERMPGKFVRFADDVTAVCNSYESAVAIESCFAQHCRETGIKINTNKSPGITLIAEKDGEIRTAKSIEYLGYSFKNSGLSLSDSSVLRIKRRISRLIHLYLFHYGDKFQYNPKRFSAANKFDWDFLGLIMEIRNYLYGGLSESELSSMMFDGKKLKKMRGLMSFYALLDDQDTLRSLDGWLVNSLRQATRKRNAILIKKFGYSSISPSNIDLIKGNWIDSSCWDGEDKPDFRIPSFRRGWRAARKYYYTFGLKDVRPPKYGYQYSN